MGKLSASPLFLHIYKRDYIDLTLVDLPGLTYKENLGPIILSMYENFISAEQGKENSLILYVASAASDLTTGQALEVARKHDPSGVRTLTIVTKIDLREKSTFMKHLKEVDSGLGTVCVRNRTQTEVEANLTFAESLAKERQVLSEVDLDPISPSKKGIPALIEHLVSL